MTKLSLTLFILLSINVTFLKSQDIRLQWGSPDEVDLKAFPIKFLGVTKDYAYIFKSKDALHVKTFVEKYDLRTMRLISVIKIKVKMHDKKIYLLDDELVIVENIPKGKKLISYGSSLNENGEQSKNKIALLEVDYLIKDKDTNQIHSVLSKDKMKLIVYPYKDSKKIFKYAIIGSKLTVQKDSFLFETEHSYSYFDQVIYNENNFYVLGSYLNANSNLVKARGKDIKTYDYFTLSNKNSSTIRPLPITLKEGHFIYKIDLFLDASKNMVVTGQYNTNQIFAYSADGIFFKRINPQTNLALHDWESEFNSEFLSHFKNADKSEKQGIESLELQKIIIKEDGGLILIFEIDYKVSSTNTWAFYANQIVPVSINNKGEIEWISYIPKRQVGSMWNEGCYISFMAVYSKSNLYLIYNDNPDNMNSFEQDKLKGGYHSNKGAITAMAIVKKDGTWTKEELLNNNQDAFYLTPAYSLKLNDSQILIYGLKDKTVVLGTLNY